MDDYIDNLKKANERIRGQALEVAKELAKLKKQLKQITGILNRQLRASSKVHEINNVLNGK